MLYKECKQFSELENIFPRTLQMFQLLTSETDSHVQNHCSRWLAWCKTGHLHAPLTKNEKKLLFFHEIHTLKIKMWKIKQAISAASTPPRVPANKDTICTPFVPTKECKVHT